jgi:hypothetical protein
MNNKIINFKISKKNEVFAFFEFAKQSNILKEKLFSFIGLKDEHVTKDAIGLFVDDLHEKEEGLMKDEIEKIEKKWDGVQAFFITQSEKIFKDVCVFQGVIVASPSVWTYYGRFFKKKLITFPYNKGADEAVFVIAHEYLHFLFYKYIYEKFKLTHNEMSSQKVWDFSEAINVVIQNQKSWIEIFKIRAKPYPQHIVLYNNILKDWNEEKDVDFLIKKYIIKNKK